MATSTQLVQYTPWGRPDDAVEYAEGIVFYSTPSHGGFRLSRERVARMPATLRGLSGYPDNWYEEDCAYAAVVYSFPLEFVRHGEFETVEQAREHARQVLGRWYPAELALAEAESFSGV